jgi:hypothetical protein
MNTRKVNINRAPLSKENIQKHKSFEDVLKQQYPHHNLIKNKWFWGGSFLTTLLIAVVVIQIDEEEISTVDENKNTIEVVATENNTLLDNSVIEMSDFEKTEGISIKALSSNEIVLNSKGENAYRFSNNQEGFTLKHEKSFSLYMDGEQVSAKQNSDKIKESIWSIENELKNLGEPKEIRKQKAEDLCFQVDIDPTEFPEFAKNSNLMFAFSSKNPNSKLEFFEGIVWENIRLDKNYEDVLIHLEKGSRKEFIIVEPVVPKEEFINYDKQYAKLKTEFENEKLKLQQKLDEQKLLLEQVPYEITVTSPSGEFLVLK